MSCVSKTTGNLTLKRARKHRLEIKKFGRVFALDDDPSIRRVVQRTEVLPMRSTYTQAQLSQVVAGLSEGVLLPPKDRTGSPGLIGR